MVSAATPGRRLVGRREGHDKEKSFHAYAPWLLIAFVVALVAGGIPLALDISQQTPDEIFEALRSTSFSQELPAGRDVNYRTDSAGAGDRASVGQVTFGHLVSTPQARGGVLLVTYIVEGREEEASRILTKARAEASEWNEHRRLLEDEHPRRVSWDAEGRYRVKQLGDLGYPNSCFYSRLDDWCHATVGSVGVYTVSRLEMLRISERPRVQELLHAAVAHLENL